MPVHVWHPTDAVPPTYLLEFLFPRYPLILILNGLAWLGSENVSYWLGAGADPNSLSDDQQCTALTAAIAHRRRGVIKVFFRSIFIVDFIVIYIYIYIQVLPVIFSRIMFAVYRTHITLYDHCRLWGAEGFMSVKTGDR